MKYLALFVALALMSSTASADPMMFVKRDAAGNLTEVRILPKPPITKERFDEYEQLPYRNPEVRRFLNPQYSFADDIRRRFREDPELMILAEWMRVRSGKTKQEMMQELVQIAKRLHPDP